MEVLRRQRGATKGKFTRLEHFVDPASNPVQQPRTEFVNRLTYLETIWSEFNQCHKSIIEVVDEDELEAEDEELEQAETRYFRIKSQFQVIIDADEDGTSSEASVPSVRANGPRLSKTVADIKLPRLDLPKLLGDVLQWTSFHDLFTSMVHNQAISNSQKMQYLKTSN
jgi:hypothetical protein